MKNKHYPWEKNEQGFLIGLVLLATIGLFYLFSNFMLPILFAVVISCATYPLYAKINEHLKSKNTSSGIMVFLMAFLVVLPIVYLFSVSATTIFDVYHNNQDAIKGLDFTKLIEIKNDALNYLPLPEKTIALISSEIDKNSILIFEKTKGFAVSTSKNFIDNSISTINFIALTLFSMYFFFRDGKSIVNKIKIITPLNDDFDDLLLMELYSLCGILTISVFSVAVIQGFAFGALTYFMDVNWLFIGVAIAISSFIPFVGSLLVWIPLAVYFFIVDQTLYAVIIVFWGMVINGFIIDNLMRPWIIGRICAIFSKESKFDLSDFKPLDNIYIIILSTLGAFPLFGVVGLFLGPIVAALSITIFDLYIFRIQAAEKCIPIDPEKEKETDTGGLDCQSDISETNEPDSLFLESQDEHEEKDESDKDVEFELKPKK